MKIKHQISIATLVMAGVFATGCSQQSAGAAGASQAASGASQVASGGTQQVASGGSQVSGGSQQQVEGGSQVSGSQQQVEAAAPVVAEPAPAAPAPAPVAPAPAPKMMAKPAPRPRPVNPWLHYHPEAPKCAKTKRHSHKYMKRGAPHRHRYACQQPRRMAPKPAQPQVDVYALQRKLKAKGYYKGPIDGIVGPGTRSALQRFMQR